MVEKLMRYDATRDEALIIRHDRILILERDKGAHTVEDCSVDVKISTPVPSSGVPYKTSIVRKDAPPARRPTRAGGREKITKRTSVIHLRSSRRRHLPWRRARKERFGFHRPDASGVPCPSDRRSASSRRRTRLSLTTTDVYDTKATSCDNKPSAPGRLHARANFSLHTRPSVFARICTRGLAQGNYEAARAQLDPTRSDERKIADSRRDPFERKIDGHISQHNGRYCDAFC
ncbi:hypothetical protein EVAR_14459_1 [Eumeta japonica]|uniref:Uncharacterized protein n=1 Tax=Eumeta variegata TaxID=151549 RepID=A0A4C1U3U7_EUMVA|nr:hypothetical protein EVAR_14459_1 [Eumeta japonica]